MQYGDCFVSAYTSCLPRVRGRIFLSSPLWMPMLMKETRLTRQKSIAEICTRERERERNLYGAGREGENLTLRTTSRSSWAVRVQRHTHIILFSLYLYRLAPSIVLYMLSVCRAEHITYSC